MKKYKVWIAIEEINEEEDFYEDVGMPESLGEFDTLEEAKEFVEVLDRQGEKNEEQKTDQ